MKKFNTYRLRFLIMLAVVAVVAVGYFTAGGIGNLCGIGFESITLLCPLGALLAMIAERTAIPMAVVSVAAVLVVCVVLGKVFCSWVCPVHFMSGLRRKKGKKASGRRAAEGAAHLDAEASDAGEARASAEPAPLTASERKALGGCATCASPCGKSKGIKIDSRHGILAAALGSTLIFGFPVFCLICPIGLTFATVLLVMRLFAFGDVTWTVLAFPAIILIEILLLPKWCQRFCPLGALLSLFSGLNRTFRPQVNAETCLRESQGKACNLCEKACPEGINLHDVAAGETTLNDCSKCRACADVCPEHAITFPLFSKKAAKASMIAGEAEPVQADGPADKAASSEAEGR